MDIVITYVDGRDPVWQQAYSQTTGTPINPKRYRDWGTLRYLLRGIEQFMPFIENVFLVVSSRSQVPQWASESLKIVEHKDIIPAEFLPTFNSTTIEMFLHCIPDLSEQYIYFNDDCFPVSKMSDEDFFPHASPAVFHRKGLFACGLFRTQVKNADAFARKAAGMRASSIYIRPQHTCSAMLKSRCKELFESQKDAVLSSISPFREKKNLCQYVFSDYFHYMGYSEKKKISNKHFSLAATSMGTIADFIANPTSKIMCVNDVNMSQERFEKLSSEFRASLEKALPAKSRFEI